MANFLAQLEAKWRTLASYSDWSGEWVHYSDINKIGINPQQFHMDLAGVYLFPKEFKTRGTLWKEKKYKFTVKIGDSAKVLDLSKLSKNDLRDVLDKLKIKFSEDAYPLNVDNFWEALKNHYCLGNSKNAGRWNADFRRLGYDAVFDDTGSIHTAEVQLVVLNPKIIKIIDVETQNIKRGQFDRVKRASDYLVSLLKPYGKVEVDIKKKRELYPKKNAVVRALVRLHMEDGKRLDWNVSEDEANHEIIVSLDHSLGIPKLRDNWGTTRDHERIESNDFSEIKNIVDRVMSKVEARAIVASNDYRMSHQAPGRDSGSPLHDLKDTYPEDFYSPQGARYYGDGQPYDQESWRILVGLKGKPNAKVRIYRAVPYEPSTDEKIEELEKALKYHLKYGKPPKEFHGKSYDQIADLRDALKKEPKKDARPPDINRGDWVSINKNYARDHGFSALQGKFKILSKLAKASDVFTDGNSIHEQGYDPK